MSPRKTELEAHFWELFKQMETAQFKILAGVTDTEYTELSKYSRGERKTRPMGQDFLLRLREDLLERLDDYERDNDLGVTT